MEVENYVSFNIAQLLKEKGFDVPTLAFYNPKKGYRLKIDTCLINRNAGVYVSAPTLQETIKWLRKVHNICIVIDCDVCDSFEFYAKIYIKGEDSWITCVDYQDNGSNDYKQVTESAIEYCLTNLI